MTTNDDLVYHDSMISAQGRPQHECGVHAQRGQRRCETGSPGTHLQADGRCSRTFAGPWQIQCGVHAHCFGAGLLPCLTALHASIASCLTATWDAGPVGVSCRGTEPARGPGHCSSASCPAHRSVQVGQLLTQDTDWVAGTRFYSWAHSPTGLPALTRWVQRGVAVPCLVP